MTMAKFMVMGKIKRALARPFEWVRNRCLCAQYPFWTCMRYDEAKKDWKPTYAYTWYESIPDGWRKAFGRELSRDIKKAVRESLRQSGLRYCAKNARECVSIGDVKEKWGELRIYASCPDSVDEVIERYGDRSRKTCIQCGKEAKFWTTGWVTPVCPLHALHDSCEPMDPQEWK